MTALILTYYSMNIDGNEYSNNDHVALSTDLRLLAALGWTITPLSTIVGAVIHRKLDPANKWVAITFDDGSWFDWYDLDHPTHGQQKSMANILRDFSQRHTGRSQPPIEATSFVIASPQARAQLEVTCMAGHRWWSDEWWPQAQHEGVIRIQNHSWDHNHISLDSTAVLHEKGRFSVVSTYQEADLDSICGAATSTIFAYPYGETSDFLVREYLPGHMLEHRLTAALTTKPEYVTNDSNRWLIPRFVCGCDWKSTEDLRTILQR
ncbi:NodB homology domain-containing protein [Candidatus Nitrotoga sp. HW29]|uniref:polysaccharide deacetylase family protein n=1 Tax=Candidatus Nitrotoga sp. HW29 TaxID=2886963 RepID=UPI001EF34DFB|nr:polysaccharide deacetylase family protein [Candidatus Nitrotoga sp. HW29]CAH1903935.1 NodB homology domain-containing protein [Candidatus Nitrotoga sp. HW29]